jgi:hypothetical protein
LRFEPKSPEIPSKYAHRPPRAQQKLVAAPKPGQQRDIQHQGTVDRAQRDGSLVQKVALLRCHGASSVEAASRTSPFAIDALLCCMHAVAAGDLVLVAQHAEVALRHQLVGHAF